MFLIVFGCCSGPITHKRLKIQHVVNIILFILTAFILHFTYFVHNYIKANATSNVVKPMIQKSATVKRLTDFIE